MRDFVASNILQLSASYSQAITIMQTRFSRGLREWSRVCRIRDFFIVASSMYRMAGFGFLRTDVEIV
jgi:hypothetical protein